MTVRGSEIVTGLFVIAAIAVFVYLAIGASAGQGTVPCVAVFDESIGQLNVGQSVTVKGFSVGKISNLSTVPGPGETSIRVDFEITEEIAEQLTDQTLAKITSVSIMGGNVLELVLNPAGTRLVADEAEGPYIIQHTEGPFNMFGMFEKLGGKIDPIIEDVGRIVAGLQENVFDPESLGRIHNMLKNLNESVEMLAQTMPDMRDQLLGPDGTVNRLNHMLDEGTGLITDFRGTVVPDLKRQIDSTLAKVDTLLSETTGLIAENRPGVKNLIGSTTTVVEGIGCDVSKVEGNVAKVGDSLNETLSDAQGVLNSPDLHASLFELRRTLQEAKLLLMSLRADASQVFWGGSGVIQPASGINNNRTRSKTEIKSPRYGY